MSTDNETDGLMPFGNRIGLFILAEISAISASAVIFLLGHIAVRSLNLVPWIDIP